MTQVWRRSTDEVPLCLPDSCPGGLHVGLSCTGWVSSLFIYVDPWVQMRIYVLNVWGLFIKAFTWLFLHLNSFSWNSPNLTKNIVHPILNHSLFFSLSIGFQWWLCTVSPMITGDPSPPWWFLTTNLTDNLTNVLLVSPNPSGMTPHLGTHFNPNICSTPMGPVTAVPEVVFSGKHSGICIYFSRILGWVA